MVDSRISRRRRATSGGEGVPRRRCVGQVLGDQLHDVRGSDRGRCSVPSRQHRDDRPRRIGRPRVAPALSSSSSRSASGVRSVRSGSGRDNEAHPGLVAVVVDGHLSRDERAPAASPSRRGTAKGCTRIVTPVVDLGSVSTGSGRRDRERQRPGRGRHARRHSSRRDRTPRAPAEVGIVLGPRAPNGDQGERSVLAGSRADRRVHPVSNGGRGLRASAPRRALRSERAPDGEDRPGGVAVGDPEVAGSGEGDEPLGDPQSRPRVGEGEQRGEPVLVEVVDVSRNRRRRPRSAGSPRYVEGDLGRQVAPQRRGVGSPASAKGRAPSPGAPPRRPSRAGDRRAPRRRRREAPARNLAAQASAQARRVDLRGEREVGLGDARRRSA